MFRLPPGTKGNLVKRWALSERVFFACGACHILAFAFLETYPGRGFEVVWMRPATGYTGNHIVVVRDDLAFDYHGYSYWPALFTHTEAKARRWRPGWTADLIPLPKPVLVSEVRSRLYDGLWLRESGQFLHDALPRAHAFLKRFPAPP
ncbi:MAG: hypothetical protein OEU46_00745 [Alphaproteobacteria bacterium]|nr:hypothetical protein [Alphaproteobacteria bacterium]